MTDQDYKRLEARLRSTTEDGDEICPFCERDPYHYVDIGVGYERVAVTCCELGIALIKDEDEQLIKKIKLRFEAANAIADLRRRLEEEQNALDRAKKFITSISKTYDLPEWVRIEASAIYRKLASAPENKNADN